MLTRRKFVVRTAGAAAAVAVLGRPGLSFQRTAFADPLASPSNAPWQARHNMTTADYQAAFDQLGGQSYRLVDVSGYELDGEAHYTAIWSSSMALPGWVDTG